MARWHEIKLNNEGIKVKHCIFEVGCNLYAGNHFNIIALFFYMLLFFLGQDSLEKEICNLNGIFLINHWLNIM